MTMGAPISAERPMKRVAIVAMGRSNSEYVNLASTRGRHRLWEEVWALNAMGGVIECDRVIMMDSPADLMKRAPEAESLQAYPDWWKTIEVPVLTSAPDKALCPMSEAYPIVEVLQEFPYGYLHCSVAYAVALAIVEGATEIGLFGCDFSYPDINMSERGRACTEFYLALAVRVYNIAIQIPASCGLLDMNEPEKLYGYEGRVTIKNGTIDIAPPQGLALVLPPGAAEASPPHQGRIELRIIDTSPKTEAAE